MNTKKTSNRTQKQRLQKSIQKLVEMYIAEMIHEEAGTGKDSMEFKKAAVKRFFVRLEKSPLKNMLQFNSPAEQMEAIIKFSELVGVPKSRISSMILGFRSAARNQ